MLQRIKIFSLAFLSFAVIIVFGLGASCGGNNTSTPVPTSTISIKSTSFNPGNASVTKDTVITWTNNDTVPHQIESDGNLPTLLSGEIQPGETFIFTFGEKGNFPYHCKIHPGMKGEITVN